MDRPGSGPYGLASDSCSVPLGGIYALERIAGDLPEDQRTMREVLSAIVREHARPSAGPDPDRRGAPATDVQGAASVPGRLDFADD